MYVCMYVCATPLEVQALTPKPAEGWEPPRTFVSRLTADMQKFADAVNATNLPDTAEPAYPPAAFAEGQWVLVSTAQRPGRTSLPCLRNCVLPGQARSASPEWEEAAHTLSNYHQHRECTPSFTKTTSSHIRQRRGQLIPCTLR
eukprot:TRINITY_DN8139_c0_g1_i3.p2 TRINITY_DN8139_c0_g1~~TRINITY_DN8139_c0_g1_i3.p2  ORF type:complete len:144 (+),score=4.82 TRINITY_DN8139_c0_g1_i3:199-630(+)